jgi:transglutaminase-like putative cysteine protease
LTTSPTLVVLRHRTAYRYDRPVVLGPQTVRLRPAPHARTPVLSYALTILPEPHTRHWHQDPQGNFLARVSFPEPTARFELTVELTADVTDTNPFDFFLEPEAATWPFRYPSLLEPELLPYRTAEPVQPWLAGLLADLSPVEQPSLDLLVALNQLVHQRVTYVTRAEPGVLGPGQTLARGSGSCRDVAWLLVQVARSLGYAARFASGYLIQLANLEAPVPEITVDRADLHAWAEVYLPGAGWIGFDATSGLITGAGHLPLACGAHPDSAAPITGTVAASAAGFTAETSVRRLPALPVAPACS